MNEHRFQDIRDAHAYAFAGKATLTLKSRKTEKHFTYRVNVCKDKPTLFFVSVLGGEDQKYNYIGICDEKGFRTTQKSTVPADALCVKAFAYFKNLKTLPYDLQVQHENTCGRCGRQLTHPESIDKGIGPECSKMIAAPAPVVQTEEMHEMVGYDA
jgi:hypothetical protein